MKLASTLSAILAVLALSAAPFPAASGGEEVAQDPVTAGVVMDLAVEGVIGRWDARRSLSGRIRHLDEEGRETEPYRSEVLNRRHKAQITINANGTYTWRAETSEVLRGKWTRTERADAPIVLIAAERRNDWTVLVKDADGTGAINAEFRETTGTLFYTARKLDDATTGTLRRGAPRPR